MKLMKVLVIAFLGMLVLASMAVPVTAADSDRIAVQIDFGNGQVNWVDVTVTPGMTAFNATQVAVQQLGLTFVAPGGFVSSIGGFSGNWPNEVWSFWTWNSTNERWDMPWVGAADIAASDNSAIAWSYAAWVDTVSFIPPHAPLATPEHRYPWASFRHDSMNTGGQFVYTPNNLTAAWSKDLGNGAIDTAIVAANGFEYIITGGVLNWTTYGYDTNSSVLCLNATGGQVWRADIGVGYQVGAPLLFGGMVIVPSANGKVYAFSATTGASLWTFNSGSGMTYGVTSSPTVYRNQIIFGTGNGKVFSLYENGTQAWNVTVAAGIYSSSPAVRNGTIYIGAESGSLYALASNGSGVIWSAPIGGKVRGSPILLQDQIVVTYVNYTNSSATGGGLASVSYAGNVQWQVSTGVTPASAVLTDKGIACVIPTALKMIGLDGTLLWSLDLGTNFAGAAPTSVNGTIFLVTNQAESKLLAISDDGELYSTKILLPANYALSAPTVADGKLYIACDNGFVYAYNLNNVLPSATRIYSVNGLVVHLEVQRYNGTLFYYNWSFGDGSFSTASVVNHTYANSGTYSVVLTVSNPAGDKTTATFGFNLNPPSAPRNLTTTPGTGRVTLNWQAPTDNGGSSVSAYLIYRSSTGSTGTEIGNVSGNTLTYMDTSSVAGTNYTYHVKAVNAQGQSAFSNGVNGTAIAIVAPSAPRNLTATAGPAKVTLAWIAPADDGGSDIIVYRVFRSDNGGAATQIAQVNATFHTYTDTTGTAGTTYTYYIKAVNEVGAGTQSISQSATPQSNDNTLLYVGIVIVIVVVAGLAVLMMRRRK